MDKLVISAILALMLVGDAPSKTPAQDQAPTLSASEQIALRSLEDKKQQLQQEWSQVAQQEVAVSREFSEEHPGWHLGAQFQPIKDEPKQTPKGAKPNAASSR